MYYEYPLRHAKLAAEVKKAFNHCILGSLLQKVTFSKGRKARDLNYLDIPVLQCMQINHQYKK